MAGPKAHSLKPRSSAYVEGLKLLGRRELSEAQVRQRLARKGHDPDEIDAAIDRLRGERSIDDARVAEAIAHTQTAVHGRGKLRVKRQIEQAGISGVTARHAIDEVFGAMDDESLLEAALAKRLRGRQQLDDEREFRRVFGYLIRQGFEADRVVRALKKFRPKR